MSYYFFFWMEKRKKGHYYIFLQFMIIANTLDSPLSSLSPQIDLLLLVPTEVLWWCFFSNKPYLKVLQGSNNLYPTLISIPDLLRLFLRFFFLLFFFFVLIWFLSSTNQISNLFFWVGLQ